MVLINISAFPEIASMRKMCLPLEELIPKVTSSLMTPEGDKTLKDLRGQVFSFTWPYFPHLMPCRGSSCSFTETVKADLWTDCLYIRPPRDGSKVRRIHSILCCFLSSASGTQVKEYDSRLISLLPFPPLKFPSINLNICLLCSPQF